MNLLDVTLLASLATSSYTFWCNVGNGINGIMPLIQGRMGSFDLPVSLKVKAWEKLTLSGHSAYVPSAFATIALNLAAAYISPHPTSRHILWGAAFLGILFIPYSLSVHPTMDRLKALDRSGSLDNKADDAEEAHLAFQLMRHWETLQLGRTALFGCIWSLCVASVVVRK